MCIVSGCPVYTPPRFSGFLSRKPKSPPFSDDVAAMSSNSFAIVPSSLAIDIVIEVFLLLRISDLVVDAVDVVNVSVSDIVAFPPGEHLAFSGIVLMHRQILLAVEEVFGAHQHSNEESIVWRSVTVQLVQLYSHVLQERCDRKA